MSKIKKNSVKKERKKGHPGMTIEQWEGQSPAISVKLNHYFIILL